MKTKILLLLALVTGLSKISTAQCPTPPLYLNSAYETNNGFDVAFLILQPVCDTIDGLQVEWKGATDAHWAGGTIDSIVQKGSDLSWGLIVGVPLTVGVKYKWRVRMYMYNTDGNPVYSAWTNGQAFTPVTLAATGCTYPGPLSLFVPASDNALLLFYNSTPTGWNPPRSGKLQYRVDGTTAWTDVKNIDPASGFYDVAGLTASTKYNWRMQNKCSSGNSQYHDGPDFTTSSGAFAKRPGVGFQKQTYTLNASNIKQMDDEDKAIVPASILKVYPNPASTQISITVDASTLTNKNSTVSLILKDMTGNIFWNADNVNLSSLKNMNVNVSKLQPGIYYLQMTGADNKTVTQQVIISR